VRSGGHWTRKRCKQRVSPENSGRPGLCHPERGILGLFGRASQANTVVGHDSIDRFMLSGVFHYASRDAPSRLLSLALPLSLSSQKTRRLDRPSRKLNGRSYKGLGRGLTGWGTGIRLYAASSKRAGLSGMMRMYANEFGQHRIPRPNNVHPPCQFPDGRKNGGIRRVGGGGRQRCGQSNAEMRCPSEKLVECSGHTSPKNAVRVPLFR